MKHLMQLAVGLSLIACLSAHASGDADSGLAKSAICAACHGSDGNSAIPNWPKIAGQHTAYLERQLGLIKNGQRPIPEMAGIVATLSDQDLADISAYFSTQKIIPGLTDESLKTNGEQLYRAGNSETEIPACMSCHGPVGEGNPLSGYPSIAGQHATYTEKMLTGFRSGTTWGESDESSEIMATVTLRMTDDEIKAVSSYLQGLHALD